jgi:hypothetical protein
MSRRLPPPPPRCPHAWRPRPGRGRLRRAGPPQCALHRRRRSQPLGRPPRAQSANAHAQYRPARAHGRRVHATRIAPCPPASPPAARSWAANAPGPPVSTTTATNGKPYVPEGQGLTKQFKKAGYRVSGAGKIYHAINTIPSEWSEYMDSQGPQRHRQRRGRRTTGFHEPVKHDLKDEDLMDWHTVNYCDRTPEASFHRALLHRVRPPQAAPAVHCAAEILRAVPSRVHPAAALPERRPRRRSAPPGCAWPKPSSDHARFIRDGNWKDAIQLVSRDRRLHRHEHRPPARRLRPKPATRQHHHRVSGAITAGRSERRITGANSPSGRSPPGPH